MWAHLSAVRQMNDVDFVDHVALVAF